MTAVHRPSSVARPQLPVDAARSRAQKRALTWLVAATALTVALSFIPYASVLTFPVRMFVTFVHESSHALAALITGGHVAGMSVSPDGSGLTYTSGGTQVLVNCAGYLGTTLFGAGLLLLSRKERLVRPALFAMGLGTLAMTALFAGEGHNFIVFVALAVAGGLVAARGRVNPVSKGLRIGLMVAAGALVAAGVAYLGVTGALFSWAVGLVCGLGLLAFGRFAGPHLAQAFLSFLAIQCSLNAIFDIKTLFSISVHSPGTHTDAVNMATLTGVPATVWAVSWVVIALGMLAFSLVVYYRQARRVL